MAAIIAQIIKPGVPTIVEPVFGEIFVLFEKCKTLVESLKH